MSIPSATSVYDPISSRVPVCVGETHSRLCDAPFPFSGVSVPGGRRRGRGRESLGGTGSSPSL